jgi:hypothetical protein
MARTTTTTTSVDDDRLNWRRAKTTTEKWRLLVYHPPSPPPCTRIRPVSPIDQAPYRSSSFFYLVVEEQTPGRPFAVERKHVVVNAKPQQGVQADGRTRHQTAEVMPRLF